MNPLCPLEKLGEVIADSLMGLNAEICLILIRKPQRLTFPTYNKSVSGEKELDVDLRKNIASITVYF